MGNPYLLTITILTQAVVSISLISLLKYFRPLGSFFIALNLLVFAVGSTRIYVNFYRDQDWKRLLAVFRKQQHNFQNHLQIISSMIQLSKCDEALNYLLKIKEGDYNISKICNLDDKGLISVLLDMVYLLREQNIDISLEIDEKNCKINVGKLQKEIGKQVIKLNKSRGKKDIKIIIDGSKFEISSPVLDDMMV